MKRRYAVAVTAMVAAAIALVSAPAGAHAEPVTDPVVPQADALCAENLADALTRLPDGKTVLQCRAEAGEYQWKRFAGPYPTSDKWLSYGPELELHGQGRRNPEIMSGEWVGYPLDSGSRCSAEQVAVVGAGELGAPQVSTGESGQQLELEVLPVVFSIKMTGYCLWQKAE